MFGVGEIVFRIQRRAQFRGPADQLARRMVGHVAEILLRLHNGIEIAAIGHIDHHLTQALHLGGQRLGDEGRKPGTLVSRTSST